MVASFYSVWKDVPGSSFTFPASGLEPGIPPKILGSFSGKCYLEATILISHVMGLVSFLVLLGDRDKRGFFPPKDKIHQAIIIILPVQILSYKVFTLIISYQHLLSTLPEISGFNDTNIITHLT